MKKNHLGFIDPVSLITLGFLLVGLVVTTAIVKNPDISLDIRNWASQLEDEELNFIKKAQKIKTISKQPAQTATTTTQTTPAQPPPVTAPAEPAAPLPIPAEPVISGICCPSNSSQGSINTCKGLPNPTACGNQSVCEWKENLNWADCPGLKPTPPMAGLCCVRDNLSADKLPSANDTCPGASYSGCTINSSLCEWKLSCSSTPPPPATLPPPAAPACGAEWKECCGSYPNGSCNSGLYCSNLDGGTCRTKVCTAKRKCEGNVLKICKADGSGWNNTTCQYGCVNNDCQAAPPPPPPPACSLNCSCAATTYKGSACNNGCGGVCPGTKCRTNGTACGTNASNCCTGFCNTSNVCATIPTLTIKCSDFGACYRETYTCEKEFGQLDCRDGYKCGVHCSTPSPSPKSSTDFPEEGRYTQQLIPQLSLLPTTPQIAQTCLQAGGNVCLSRKLCLTEEGGIINSSTSDCSEEQVCCSFNSKEEKDSLTPTDNAVVPSPIAVFFSDQYHELPPEAFLPTQIVPTMIILHWDGQGGSPYGWTTNGTYRGLGFETSAHFAVGTDGVLQMLPMTNTTVTRSQGAIGRNDQAINIEMAGWNFDATPPTQKEIDASINLIIKLMQAYHLTINDVFGHSEQDTVNSNGQACVMGVDSDCRDRYKSDPGKEFMDKIRKELANRLVSQSPAAPAPLPTDTCLEPECMTEKDCLLNYGQDYTCRVSVNACQNKCVLKQSPVSTNPSPETFVYYSQRDPQWEDAHFTCPDGTTVSFANSGCGETVTAMLLSTYVNSSYTPAAVKEEWFTHPNYCSGSGITTSNDILTANGFTINNKVVSETILKEYIKAGSIGWASLEINGTITHHTLITGVDENGNFIFNDPWFGPNTILEGVDFEIIGFEIIKPPEV